MTVHDDIRGISPDSPAAILGKRTLAEHVVGTLRETLFSVFRGPVQINPDLNYGAQISGVSSGPTGGAISEKDVSVLDTKLEVGSSPDELYLRISKPLKILVDIGFVDKKTNHTSGGQSYDTNVFSDEFSTAVLLISELKFRLRVGVEGISSSSAASGVKMAFNPSQQADLEAIAAKRGVSVDDLHRIEGAVGAGMQSFLAKALAESRRIQFGEFFPGIKFEGRIAPHLSSQSDYMILVPSEGITGEPSGPVSCNGIGNGMGDFAEGTVTPIDVDDGRGQISVGGITPADGQVSLGMRGRGIGEVGLYLPLSVAKGIAPTTIPGVRVTAGSGGTLSWQAEAFAGFKSVDVRIDPRIGSIEADFEFTLDASGWLEADLGKILGTHRIGAFVLNQTGPNNIGVSFVPKITDGKLVIKPIIRPDTRISPFDVRVNVGKFFGLIFGSFGLLVGFVLDVIIQRVVRRELPTKIRDGVSSALSNSAWTLLDGRHWLNHLNIGGSPVALYDGKQDSLLVSVSNDGGVPTTVGHMYG